MAGHFETEVLSFGDLPIRLLFSDGLRFADSSPVSRFRSRRLDVVSDVSFRIGSLEAASGRARFDSDAVWRMFEVADGLRFELRANERIYRIATFSRQFDSGEVLIDESVVDPYFDPFEYPLDELLLTNLLSIHGGVEVHGLGISQEGEGILFVGHSGAGKSTIGDLWRASSPKARVLSDDRVIIRPDQEGQLRAWGTPWHGESGLCDPGSAPLDRIFILRQAPDNSVRRLAPVVAAGELLSRCFYPVYDADAVRQAADFVVRTVEEVPVYELAFRKDAGAVDAARSC